VKQDVQIRLIQRVLSHVDNKTTDTGDRTAQPPVATYDDPARHALERDRLFRGSQPLCVAHVSQVPGPGDFITHDAAGVPILVARDRDGALHATLNVCRHRGTRVEMDACGTGRKAFVCPYHGWAYRCDGRLQGVPHRAGFPDVTEATHSLVPLALSVHAGLIFVRPDPAGGPFDAAALLGPDIADDLTRFGFGEHLHYDPVRFDKRLGWKLAIDIFLEAYHLRTAHKDSIYKYFFDNVAVVEPHGPHLRNIFPKRSITALADTDPQTWRLREHANVLYHLFPNTLILVEPDHAGVFHAYPTGPDRCVVHAYTLIPEPATSEKARNYWAANNAILYGATDEDFAMGESIQAGLQSGANEAFTFGLFEHALTHFHGTINRFVND